jgi:hypothetical protein
MLFFIHGLEEYNSFISLYLHNTALMISFITEANYNIQTQSSISDAINQN